MKKLCTLLLVLTGITSFAQQIVPLQELIECEQNTDGLGIFTFDPDDDLAFEQINPDLYAIAYFLTSDDATNQVNPIPPYEAFFNTVNPQTIWARIWKISNPTLFAITTKQVFVQLQPSVPPPFTHVICDNGLPNGGTTTFDLTTLSDQLTGGGCATCTIYYNYQSQYIANPEAFVLTSNPQTFSVGVISEGSSACNTYTEFTIQVNPLPSITSLDPLFDCAGHFDLYANIQLAPYDYSFYVSYADANTGTNPWNPNQVYQGSSVFVKLSLPNANPTQPVCYTIIEQQLHSSADFEIQLSVSGQQATVTAEGGSGNYQYVIDQNTPQLSNVFGNLASGNHTIYVTDLACSNLKSITFQILPDAGFESTVLANLEYYPNPVADVLTLKNEGAAITGLQVYNTLGQNVVTAYYNSTLVAADLSMLQSGIYMVKVQAGNAVKTIKIVKQ